MKKNSCPHCGSLMIEYKHRLNVPLIKALLACYLQSRRKPFKVSEMGLSHAQLGNWQKLRYWGLVDQQDTEGRPLAGGVWRIADPGEKFIIGDLSLPKSCVTYRGVFQRFEGEEVYISELVEGYQVRSDYATEARQRYADQNIGQGTLI